MKLLSLFWLNVGILFISFFGASATELVPQMGHTNPVNSVAISSDGFKIVSAGSDRSIRLWDTKSVSLIREFRDPTTEVTALAISSDGKQVVSGGQDGKLILWDTLTGERLKTFTGHTGRINSVAFSSDGAVLLSGSGDNTICLWIVSSGTLSKTIVDRNSVVRVAFSADASLIASANWNNDVRVWNLDTGKAILDAQAGQPSKEGILHLSFSTSGVEVRVGTNNNTLRTWNLNKSKTVVAVKGPPGNTAAFAVSPDGLAVLSDVSTNGTFQKWDAKSGKVLDSFSGHQGGLFALSFLNDGPSIVSGGVDETVILWTGPTSAARKVFKRRSAPIHSGAYLPNGTTIAAGSEKNIFIWDFQSATLRQTIPAHGGSVLSIATATDDRTIYSASRERELRIWDGQRGALSRQLKYSPSGDSLKVSRNGNFLGFFDVDEKLNILANEKLFRKLPTRFGSYAFSPDNSEIATVNLDTIQFTNIADGSKPRKIKHETEVAEILYSPDGRAIIYADIKGSIFSKNLLSQSLNYTVPYQGYFVGKMATSQDGNRIGIAGSDNIIRVLNARTGAQENELKGHTDQIQFLAFSPDGRLIASGGADTTLRIWSADSGSLLVTAVAFDEREWLIITPEGFFVSSPGGADLLRIVEGFTAFTIDQVFQSLYRPDLVREKLAGDPRGLVREAANRLDLQRVISSGSAPDAGGVRDRDQSHWWLAI
jgi:WD40 repeat protein